MDRTYYTLKILTLLPLIVAGCDRSGELAQQEKEAQKPESHHVSIGVTARSVIAQCAAAYQRLQTYCDDGYVSLRYELDGKLLEDRAPLAVAFDRNGKLGLRVYSVTAAPTGRRWRLRLGDREPSLSDQVLSRAIPSRADFEWLLSDPIVADQLSAGVAGFPPQLDLLLSRTPMDGLQQESAELTFLPPDILDGRACHVIKVAYGARIYQLWIDQASLLLRRLTLPKENLPTEMLADIHVSKVKLSIEILGIKTNAAIDWSPFQVEETERDMLIQRFVPAPPSINTDGLGKKIAAFKLLTPDGQNEIRCTADTKATVKLLIWLADHPACKLSVKQVADSLAHLSKHHPDSFTDVQVACVWAEPQPPPGVTFDELVAHWQLPGMLVVDSDALGRDIFGIMEAPSVVVLDGENRLQFKETSVDPLLDQLLPEVLRRLSQGEDLAAVTIRTLAEDRSRYAAELRMVRAIDANPASFPNTGSYPFRTVELRELAREQLPSQVVALTTDSEMSIWMLTAKGELRRRRVSGEMNPTSTPWQPSGQSSLAIAPGGRFIAHVRRDLATAEIYDLQKGTNRLLQLNGGSPPVDFQWLVMEGSESPRFAVISADRQIVLLDPLGREQLSGICPAPAIALVPSIGDRSWGNWVAMANRQLEPLLIGADTSLSIQTSVHRERSQDTVDGPIKIADSAKLSSLDFQPDSGPWIRWQDKHSASILARGWLASDEPAIFLLDEQFRRVWQYRMPIDQGQNPMLAPQAARYPASGEVIWAVGNRDGTIHLLEATARWNDHLRLDKPLDGLALVPSGDQLLLIVAQSNQLISYAVIR